MASRFAGRLLVSASALVLASCSGGGGGSGPTTTTPPPPPPVNRAPVINVTVSADNADEGQSFTIDLSGSTDADGQSLSYSVSQTSGPGSQIVQTGTSGVFTVTVPEVDASEPAVFRASASDGSASAGEDVTVTVNDVVLGPSETMFGPASFTLSGFNSPRDGILSFAGGVPDLIALEETPAGDGRRVRYFPRNSATGELDTEAMFAIAGAPADAGEAERVSRTVTLVDGRFSGFDPQKAVFFPGGDRIDILDLPEAPSTSTLVANSIDVADPCAAVSIIGNGLLSLGGLTGLSDLVVGSDGELVRLINDGNSLIPPPAAEWGLFGSSQTLASGGAYCMLAATTNDIFAYDADTGAVVRSSRNLLNTNFNAAEVFLPNVNGTVPVRSITAVTSDLGLAAVVVVRSDLQHDGQHEVTIYSTPYLGLGAVEATTFSWTKGIPGTPTLFDLADIQIRGTDILLPLETVPYAMLIEDVGSVLTGDLGPDYEAPVYVGIPLGVTQMRAGDDLDGNEGFLATVTRTGEISFLPLAE